MVADLVTICPEVVCERESAAPSKHNFECELGAGAGASSTLDVGRRAWWQE